MAAPVPGVQAIWITFTTVVAAALAGADIEPCAMRPPHESIPVPTAGFHWVAGFGYSGACEQVPDEAWAGTASGSDDLLVLADGPSGSGRYWRVTVALRGNQSGPRPRGFCVRTSTIGWRTLQRFQGGPLLWAADRDGNGLPGFILWDSFPVRPGPDSTGEYALVAWIYRLSAADAFVLDWDATRRKAVEIAAAYDQPLDGIGAYTSLLRRQAFLALSRFASGRCEPRDG